MNLSTDSIFGEDDGAFSEGSADRAGVDEGVYKFGDDGKLQPYLVNGTYSPGGTLGVSDYDKPEPAFMETLGAAFRQENLIGSGFVSRPLPYRTRTSSRSKRATMCLTSGILRRQVRTGLQSQRCAGGKGRHRSGEEGPRNTGRLRMDKRRLAVGAASLLDPQFSFPAELS